jgi:hypothetical protein
MEKRGGIMTEGGKENKALSIHNHRNHTLKNRNEE